MLIQFSGVWGVIIMWGATVAPAMIVTEYETTVFDDIADAGRGYGNGAGGAV